MRASRLTIAASAFAVMLLVGEGAPATAAAPTDPSSSQIEATITAMEAEGASQAAIDKALYQQFRIRRMPADEGMVPMSSNGNVNVPAVTFYKSDTSGWWWTRGTWSWNTNCAIGGCEYVDCWLPGDCGGNDGFGIRTSTAIDDSRSDFYTYNNIGTNTTKVLYPDTQNEYGVTWVAQDKSGTYYTWHKGVLYFYWKPLTCTGKKGVARKWYSRLYHTWDTATLSGIGIGKADFSVSWNQTGHEWAASRGPVSVYPCGA